MTELLTKRGKTRGASIDLTSLHNDMDCIPHPRSLNDNPGRQQEVRISLIKNLDTPTKLTDIPHFLHWHGTNIGHYDDDGNFVSVVEDESECDVERIVSSSFGINMIHPLTYDPDMDTESTAYALQGREWHKITLVKDRVASDQVGFHFYFKGELVETHEKAAELGISCVRIKATTEIHL